MHFLDQISIAEKKIDALFFQNAKEKPLMLQPYMIDTSAYSWY